MIDLPLIFLGGLLGSSHCVGMCGGFAVTVGSNAANWRDNLLRQSVYSGGRLFTYAAIGAAAGYGGRRLATAVDLFDVRAVLAIVAGALLISQGLRATGLWTIAIKRYRGEKPPTESKLSPQPIASPVRPPGFKLPHCLRPGLLGSMLRRADLAGPMLAGMLTGFLPCGLVYAMAALAVSSGDLLTGLLTMICFGIGTIPLMLALGLGTSIVGATTRRRIFQLAGWSVVVTGALSLGRGAYALSTERFEPAKSNLPACPHCHNAAEPTIAPAPNGSP